MLTDFYAWLGQVIVLSAIIAAMLGIGISRGWNIDPLTGKFSFFQINDETRFWNEPNINNTFDQTFPGREGPLASGSWYYWRLPPPQTNYITRLVPWVLYLAHQCSVWGVIWYAQNRQITSYSSELRNFNILAIGLNVFFHVAHLVQTHVTYDALAPEVSEASSQGSVILLLCMIIALEYPSRGLFFGWYGPRSKMLPNGPIAHIRQYHGYYFAWAAIYTFWYHPMESTVAHLMGFMHTSLILIQGTLMYTPMHKNVYWRLLVEIWVMFHATTVAFQLQQGTLWRMFFFGFSFILVTTQIHGIPFFKNTTSTLIRITPLMAWIAAVAAAYGVTSDVKNLNEVIRIPAIIYALFLFVYLTTFVTLKIRDRICLPTKISRWFGIVGFCVSYGLILLVSTLVEVFHVKMDLLLLAIYLILVYALIVPLSQISLDLSLEKDSSSTTAKALLGFEKMNSSSLSANMADLELKKEVVLVESHKSSSSDSKSESNKESP